MKRVLVVDDQPEIRKLIQLALEFEGLEVREAADGHDGLKAALAWRPDLVLLDVMMPGATDGMDLCRRLRAEPTLADLRIVMLSARGDPRDQRAGREAGADEYLVKPFNPLHLVELVERLLA